VRVLFEPVALLGWAMLALSALAWRRSTAGNRGLFALAGGLSVAYFWFASPLGANLMVGALEHGVFAVRECAPGDGARVYVVLAGGKTGTPESDADVAHLQEAGFRRTVEGATLARTDAGSLLVLAGGSGESVTEADLMRHLALRLGVSAERIRVERSSGNTHESAVGVARLLRNGGTRIHLVTSAMHMPRAAAAFGAQGIEVCPRAVDRRYVRPDIEDALIPQITALVKSTAAMHEFVGYAWYYLSGRL